jgi:hypothetical protein
MAGHHYSTVINAATGKPVASATVYVYQAGATVSDPTVTGGTYATIFSDDGVTSIDQSVSPVTSDSNGFYEFWTNETSVIIQFYFDGANRKAIDDVEVVGGTVSSDITALGVRLDAVEAVTEDQGIIDLAALAVTDGNIIVGNGTNWVAESGATARTSLGTPATGDVTASGLTMNTARLLGRTTASAGAIEELTAGTGLTLSGGDLSVNQSAVKPTESFVIAASDETTALTTGTAKVTFRMPYAFTLTAVRASVTTAPTGATLNVDINEGGVSVLSTVITIDATEKTSTTAATPAVISDGALADDAEMTIDIDQIGSTIAGAGLKVYLIGTRA